MIMNEAIEKGCLLPYKGEGFFEGALVEPLSCIVAGFKANFHLRDRNDYDHTMGIRENGALAILGGTGPMGFLAIDYAIHNDRRPKHLVVTGRTQSKLDMAKRLYPVEEAAKYGVTLTYVLTADEDDIVEELKALTPDAKGFDDIFLMAAKLISRTSSYRYINGSVVKQRCSICILSLYFGSSVSSNSNFYNIHYNATHFVGTSGSNTQDMKDAIALIENKTVNVAKIATHIMGLNHVCESILNLPKMPGGKKIVYSGKEFPVTDVSAFGENNELEKHLKELVDAHDGLWNAEAEQYFLEHAKDI